jgi:hypothetical protein
MLMLNGQARQLSRLRFHNCAFETDTNQRHGFHIKFFPLTAAAEHHYPPNLVKPRAAK